MASFNFFGLSGYKNQLVQKRLSAMLHDVRCPHGSVLSEWVTWLFSHREGLLYFRYTRTKSRMQKDIQDIIDPR